MTLFGNNHFKSSVAYNIYKNILISHRNVSSLVVPTIMYQIEKVFNERQILEITIQLTALSNESSQSLIGSL